MAVEMVVGIRVVVKEGRAQKAQAVRRVTPGLARLAVPKGLGQGGISVTLRPVLKGVVAGRHPAGRPEQVRLRG